jgi:hypothetical protein
MTAQQSEISILAGNSNAMVGELLLRARDRRMRIRMVALAGTLMSTTLADGPLSGFWALRRIGTTKVKG